MKLQTKLIPMIALSFIGFLSCKDAKIAESLDVIHPLDGQQVTDFAAYIDDIQIIPLEFTDSSLVVAVEKMLITKDKDMVLLTQTGIILFDRDGKYRFNIGGRGAGPGEYVKIFDICLSDDQKYLLAVDVADDVLKYSISDGAFVEKIKPVFEAKRSKVEAICPAKRGGFFLFHSNPGGNPSATKDTDEKFYCLVEYDKNGKQIAKHLERKDFNISMARITQSYDNNYFIRPLEGDKMCYKVDDGELKKAFAVDFKDKHIPAQYIYKDNKTAWDGLRDYMFSDYYKSPIYFQDTKDNVYFSAIGPEATAYDFLMSKKDGKILKWNDNGDRFPLIFKNSDKEYFYAVFDDYSELDKVDSWSALKKHIVQSKDLRLAEQDNPKVIKVKFKT